MACIAVAAFFFASNRLRSRPTGQKIMLIVLPFQNLSEDPQQEYFADGMT
jgi:TolB-like protein